ALSPESRRSGVSVIGDHAPDWVERLALQPDVSAPAVQFVLLDGWRKVAFIGGEAEICGQACSEGAILVRTVVLRPGGSYKQVVLELSGLDALPDRPGQTCLEEILRAESRVVGPAEVPACAAGSGDVRTQRLLPFGLGRI
ncbi:MAG: hypothetical protein AAFY03_06525, partial [Pseudomonadota bacterium]